MAVFLGIDGGGSGCRAAVCDAAGRILGRGQAGPANIASDPAGARDNLQAAAGAALAEAGLPGPGALRATVMGLAGANLGGAVADLVTALPYAPLQVVSDAVTAVAGALGDRDGIVAAMGTGSVLAVARAGTVRLYGGRGFLLGDEGSGAVLGRRLMAEALRAEDGFAEMTPLLAQVLQDLGGAEGVIALALRGTPADFAAYAPRVAAAEDPAAVRLMAAASDEVAAMIDALQARDGPLPVVFLGGLGPVYAARLAGRWPMLAAAGTGLDGALVLARRAGGPQT